MTPLPHPPPGRGLTWRPWSPADAETLARLMLRIHEVEHLEHVPGPEQFRWIAGQAEFDPATQSLTAFDGRGEARADTGVWAHLTDVGARVFFWCEVDPDYAELRPFLIRWAEERARMALAAAPRDVDRVIRISVEEHRAALRAALEGAGFEAKRSFAVMQRSLADLPPLPDLPDGVRVEPWSEDIDDAIRDADVEAFADHWGSLPMSPESWRTMYRESQIFRRDLSFAALDGDRVVSYLMSEFDEEDVATRGRIEFYIQRVGTRRSHRRLGLASHLLVRMLHAAADAGGDTAALEVDESSHTNATVVYSRLGFAVAERSIHYLKTG